jgi:hypothetical protein
MLLAVLLRPVKPAYQERHLGQEIGLQGSGPPGSVQGYWVPEQV